MLEAFSFVVLSHVVGSFIEVENEKKEHYDHVLRELRKSHRLFRRGFMSEFLSQKKKVIQEEVEDKTRFATWTLESPANYNFKVLFDQLISNQYTEIQLSTLILFVYNISVNKATFPKESFDKFKNFEGSFSDLFKGCLSDELLKKFNNPWASSVEYVLTSSSLSEHMNYIDTGILIPALEPTKNSFSDNGKMLKLWVCPFEERPCVYTSIDEELIALFSSTQSKEKTFLISMK